MIGINNILRNDRPKGMDTGRAAVGEHSRPLRYLIVTLVVLGWWALGRLLNLNVSGFTLLGVPILLAFQVWIHRQPLLSLWVRSAPPLRVDAWFILIWFLFSIVPTINLVSALNQRDLWSATSAAAAILGAFGLAYALRSMKPSLSGVSTGRMALYFLIAVVVGLLPLIPTLVLPRFVHMHINGQTVTAASLPPLAILLQVGLGRFLMGPLGFVVEEVFFRGGLDTYLHRGEKGTGWLSAVYVSALWGLWHLPGAALTQPNLLSTVVSLLVAQIILGVPLSLLWRKSGNLAVPDTTHAVLEAVRSILSIPG
jgi:Type II CAAX prenyl endopeptidase Rce1-like